MAEQVDNLKLEHLKRFQITLDRIERDVREMNTRQNETHSAVIGLRRDHLDGADVSAHLHVRFDELKDRQLRLDRRLDLTN